MVEVAILGATGYTGSELIRLLNSHPGVKLAFLSSESHAGSALSKVHPQFSGAIRLELQPLQVDRIPKSVELVFCALPHGSSLQVVPELRRRKMRVVDLSADFRLSDPLLYPRWYGHTHPSAALLEEAVYGLSELYGPRISEAGLVANPGCYPTSAILALAPLALKRQINWESVLIDAKSGVSGAGRTPKQDFHFPDCTENFKAYRVGNHQHTPEIEQELSRLAGEKVVLTFTPHLAPMIRGILSTVYLKLRTPLSLKELYDIYGDFYRSSPFVRLREDELPETRFVRGSNYCDLALRLDERTGRLIVLSAIDNLVKGASGQAVQNMNLMLGFAQETGLVQIPL